MTAMDGGNADFAGAKICPWPPRHLDYPVPQRGGNEVIGQKGNF
jgi:hypothetical protein